MKIATLISSIITVLFMLSTMICGLWIRANEITDSSSALFHIGCGIASVIFSITSLTLLIIMLKRMEQKG